VNSCYRKDGTNDQTEKETGERRTTEKTDYAGPERVKVLVGLVLRQKSVGGSEMREKGWGGDRKVIN